MSVCVHVCLCVGNVYKASELVAVKSKADELVSQKAALDDHIATLKVTLALLTFYQDINTLANVSSRRLVERN